MPLPLGGVAAAAKETAVAKETAAAKAKATAGCYFG